MSKRRMTTREARAVNTRRKIYRWRFPIKITSQNVALRRRSRLAHKIAHFEKVKQRDIGNLMTRQCLGIQWAKPPLVVTLTRVYGGRNKRWDDDAVPPAMKAIRDGIASALGVDDGNVDQIMFVYKQLREDGLKVPEVSCEIEGLGE